MMTRLVATSLVFVSALASADPLSDGLAYLLSQQAPDGSFGGATGEQKIIATVEALQTLRELGQGRWSRHCDAGCVAADIELHLRRRGWPTDFEGPEQRTHEL